MGEKLDNFLELKFKLILRQLQTIFPEDVISVSSQDFCHCESTDFKVDKCFKSLSSLDFKTCISFETMFDNKSEIVKHFNWFINYLAIREYFFDGQRLPVCVDKLDRLESFFALLGNKSTHVFADRLETICLLFVKLVQ